MQVASNYIDYKIDDNGDLKVTFDQAGLPDIEQEFALHPEWDSDTRLSELLTPMLENGWTRVNPQDIKVKSQVFILAESEDVETDEYTGKVQWVGVVYWCPEHLFYDLTEHLLTYGELTFINPGFHEDIDNLERRNRRFQKRGLLEKSGKLLSCNLYEGGAIIYLDKDNCMLCSECAQYDASVQSGDSYLEGPTYYCEECNKELESAYGDPDAPIQVVLHFKNSPDYPIWIEKDDFKDENKIQDAILRICESDNIDPSTITHWTKVEED